ncbi:hypothetical protein RvY_14457 [Ramazzottius varieornatus]|uniref:Uncharacterized protein n=1 Tax=Ramazzottius varieornatus TaxID=947166 RepID=A0A1D1VRG7_RAMVA|nr:hypothetical protein RvY_14457 [Ramazzottius varieornatus]
MRGFDRYSIIEVGGLPVDYVPNWHYVTEISTKYNWRAIKHHPTVAEQRPVERGDAFPRPESEMSRREKGILIHKERELAAAVHLIPLPTFLPITREDLFAFNYILKPFGAFKTLITKPWVNLVAEILLFGCPAGRNMMVTGKVDQIICDWRNDAMFIGDLKTTGLRTVPDSFYEEQTCIQLNLYHRLVDDFVSGKIPMDAVAGIVDFDLQKDFTPHFQQGIE